MRRDLIRDLLIYGFLLATIDYLSGGVNCQRSLICRSAERISRLIIQRATEVRGIKTAVDETLRSIIPPIRVPPKQQMRPPSNVLMKWRFQDAFPGTVYLKFFSQERGTTWPRRHQVFVLREGESALFELNCRTNELICYSAWPRYQDQIYWGTGPYGDDDCNSCCVRCIDKTLHTTILR